MPHFASILRRHEQSGVPFANALRQIMLDASVGWYSRAAAAKLLAIADAESVLRALLNLFHAETEKNNLWETALALETLGDRGAVGPLVHALYDANPDRRHAAARALGWIHDAGPRAAKALMRTLADHSQLQPVREEAAESLAYLHYAPSIPVLISALDEPDVRIRFWSTFALGKIGQWQRGADAQIISALERALPDEEVPPSNWWSVGKEALALLGQMEPKYSDHLRHETQRVLSDPHSSAEDLRWAQANGDS